MVTLICLENIIRLFHFQDASRLISLLNEGFHIINNTLSILQITAILNKNAK